MKRWVAGALFMLVMALGVFLIEPFESADHDASQLVTKEADQTQTIAGLRKPSSPQAKSVVSESKEPRLTDFSAEQKRVEYLTGNLPRTRAEVLALVLAADPYTASGKAPAAHSMEESLQMKWGALKVMALRELLKSEDPDRIQQDLTRIQREAQDPTLRHIASAALASLSQGRSFFDDFLDGIAGLPLDG